MMRFDPQIVLGARRRSAAILLVLCLASPLTAQTDNELPHAPAWNYDVIRLRNGNILRGLLVEEFADYVKFQCVRRRPGKPTVSFTSTITRAEIDHIEKLSPMEKARLQERLAALDPSGELERRRMEALELDRIEWDGKPGEGYRYESEFFILRSNADEEIVRRVAVRLEQIYVAYGRYLPMRYQGGKPTTIILARSLEEYYKMPAKERLQFRNPAYFDPQANRILCGSDLERIGTMLRESIRTHQAELNRLDADEAKLKKLFARDPKTLARYLEPIQESRIKIARADRDNNIAFDKAVRELLSLLYHEAFHAYLMNFVYPPLPRGAQPSFTFLGEVPIWLNEGLAQVFQSSFVEAGELRVGHADPAKLARVRDALRTGAFLSVRDLLRLDPKRFRADHLGANPVDQAYLASWALAFYLLFERRLLGSEALDEFVRLQQTGIAPEAAFTKLIGRPIEQFEQEYHRYLRHLQANGVPDEGFYRK